MSISARADSVVLVVLIVKEQVLLVHGIQDTALVRVCSTFVRSDGQDGGRLLVRYVVDGERVLVVAVANLFAFEFCIWATVDQALSIVHIAIFGCTENKC